MIRYELIVCWDNGTWSDCVFIQSEKDLTREEAEQKFVSMYMHDPNFKERKAKVYGIRRYEDIRYVGILHYEEI
jgi:hypothetical protein